MSTNLFKVVVMNLPLDDNVIKEIKVNDNGSVIINDKFTVSHGDLKGTYEFREQLSETSSAGVVVSDINDIIDKLRYVLIERIELGDIVVNEDGKRGKVIITHSKSSLAENFFNVLYEDNTLALVKSVRLGKLKDTFKKA